MSTVSANNAPTIQNDDVFYEKYHTEYNQVLLNKPLVSHPDDMCGFGGCLYETYGEEYHHILDMIETDPKRVWTIIECDDTITICAGWRFVNRMGYLITTEEWSDPSEEYKCEE